MEGAMKTSEKMLELLKRINSEYMKAIELGEDDYHILNSYISVLSNFTMKYLEFKRKENKEIER